MARLRRVDSKKEQERLVDEFVTRGYKISAQSRYTAKVKDRDWGNATTHAFIALLTLVTAAIAFEGAGVSPGAAWAVMIVANVAYALYCRYTAEVVIIKVDTNTE